ncbi:MAG: hypothetical protein WDM89_21775 [Rhizomicrobium sp.]
MTLKMPPAETDRFKNASRRLEEQMETQLALLTGAMRGSVTRADSVTDDDDEYGHRRDSHIGQAVKIGAVSAQIVTALGKYAGEFQHNIKVTRTDEDARAAKAEPVREGDFYANRKRYTLEELDAMPNPEFELPRSSSHPPIDRWLKEEWARHDAEMAAEAAKAERALSEMEGVPPNENCGSND